MAAFAASNLVRGLLKAMLVRLTQTATLMPGSTHGEGALAAWMLPRIPHNMC